MKLDANFDQTQVPASDNFTQQILCKIRGAYAKSTLGSPKAARNRNRQQRAIALKIAGWTYAAIGRELGVTRQYVQQHLVAPSIQTKTLLWERAHDCCEKCQIPIKNRKGHVHHVKQQQDYNHLDNLLYLCNSCHLTEHGGVEFFTELPPGPGRRAASEAFAQPYLEHIAHRYCMACGAPRASFGLCKDCLRKHKGIYRAKVLLCLWQRGNAKTAAHALSQAIYEIRKNDLKPEDFGPRKNGGQ